MASLSNYNANGQKVVQLFAGVFNAGVTGDLVELGTEILETASLASVIDALLDKDTIKQNYPMYAAYVTDTAFVDQLIDNMSANSGVAAAVTDDWKAYVVSIAGDYASRGALVADLLTFVTNYTGANADMVKMQTVIENRAEVGAYLAQNGAYTYTSFGALMNQVKNVDLTDDSVTDAQNGVDLGDSASLTTGQDTIDGSSASDLFTARIINNSNTLQSGDVINGGSGSADRLEADIGDSQAFAIAAETTSVEQVAIRAQTIDDDATDNNMSIDGEVQIDAERMQDVTRWESNNSRADLIIEDVRINDDQITSDITIAMVETDPGHVDFGVYFDQYSLRAGSSATSVLEVELLDTRSQALGTGPLKDNPYWGFAFYLNGEPKEITSEAIDEALTYTELKDAIQDEIDALVAAGDSELAGFVASLGSTFTRFDTESGAQVTGTAILLTDNNGGTLTIDDTVGWQTQNGTVPASSGIHTNIEPFAPDVDVDLVTSKIILDDVGRGSTGGDLVVGGLSVGDTSTSRGVERFEITVLDNSKLQSINSTNNTLEEVTIVNGQTSHHGITNAYSNVVTAEDAGNLTVNGSVNDVDNNTEESSSNESLPGSEAQHDSGFGFSDVRLIDGSSMAGELNFTAEVTEASIAKYLDLTDSAANPASDNIAFSYSGGSNDDTMSVMIDSTVAASHTLSGREDFTFAINGGSGDDSITVDIGGDNGTETGPWVADQSILNNISIDGGAGNDTIMTPGAGKAKITAGTGDDTVYVDNTGDIGAVWLIASTNVDEDDLQSVANTSKFMYRASLTVTFSGASIGGAVTDPVADSFVNGWESTVEIPTGTNYAVTQRHVNQAIKDAINDDAVLSKVLLAEDGPANSLIITSLIDGTFVEDDILVTVTGFDYTTLSASQESTVESAYQAFAEDSEADIADAEAADIASVAAFNLVSGMDVAQVLAGSSMLVVDAAAPTTQGADATFEVFTVDFTGIVIGAGDTVNYDGMSTAALVGGETAAQVAAALAVVVFPNWTMVDNLDGTATFTAAVAGVTVDAVTADFTITDGGSGTGVVAAAITLDTDGAAAIAEEFVVTVSGTTTLGETVTFDGATTAAFTGAETAIVAATAINGVVDASADWVSVDNGDGTLTVTAAVAGAMVDVVDADFVSSIGLPGTISTAHSDNSINLGAGTDVLVMGTGALSNDTLVFTGYDQGDNAIINFEDTVVASRDKLNFTAYLTSKESTSGSAVSATRIATTLNANVDVEANSVTILSGLAFDDAVTTDTFAGLSASDLLSALNNGDDYGSVGLLDELDAGVYADEEALYNNAGTAVVMVENNQNEGEYAVFELTFEGVGNADNEFATAQLIGVYDFGASLTLVDANLS